MKSNEANTKIRAQRLFESGEKCVAKIRKQKAAEKQIKAGEKHDEMSLEADAIMAYASRYKSGDFVNGFDFEAGAENVQSG